MRVPMRLLVVCGTAGMVAGCGSGDESNAIANGGDNAVAVTAAVDPCGLLTAEEVAAVVGEKIVSAKAEGDTCTYANDDAGSVEVQYSRGDAETQMATDRQVAGVLGKMGDEAAESGGAAGADVNAMIHDGGGSANIGDESLVGPNARLSFRKGDSYVAITPPIMHSRISYSGNPMISTEDKQKMARDLALKALAKLP